MRVLVVEDHADVASSTLIVLEILKYKTKHAQNGLEAIAIAPDFSPDIMLIDIGLPDMDGFDLAKRLRAMPQFKSVIMIALTGFDCEERCREAGFDHYYKKPMDLNVLKKLAPPN
jgi:two-component system CheB/CheR fusion protein